MKIKTLVAIASTHGGFFEGFSQVVKMTATNSERDVNSNESRITANGYHHVLWMMVLFVMQSLFVPSSFAQATSQLIDDRISLYKKAYPQIEFKLLRSKADFDQLLPLTSSLGKDLSNVDYEHPDSTRVGLIEAQEYRIGLQLDIGNATATLFKTPNARITNKPYTCLVTLNIPLLDQSALAASRFMYDMDDAALSSLSESYLIDNKDFLVYSFDHEMFHCVDAYSNGFLFAMTQDPVKSSLDRSRAELRAEIFAAFAHLSRQPNGKRFLLNQATARTLSLLSGDVEHYTSGALIILVGSSTKNDTHDIKALVKKSMHFADNHAVSYAEYKQFLVDLRTVLEELDIVTDTIFTEYPSVADEAPSDKNVESLRNSLNMAKVAINY